MDDPPKYLKARTDEQAAAELWEGLQDSVRPIAAKYTILGEDEVQSLAGMCFAKAINEFNGDGAFRGYFAQRLKWLLIDENRRQFGDTRTAEPRTREYATDPQSRDDWVDDAPGPEEATDGRDLELAWFASAGLTEAEQDIVRSRVYAGESNASIAERLGLTPGTISLKYNLAVAALRRAVESGRIETG